MWYPGRFVLPAGISLPARGENFRHPPHRKPAQVDVRSLAMSSLTDAQLERIANGEDPGTVIGDGGF